MTWRLEGLPWILGLDTGLALLSGNRTEYSSWGQPVDALPTLSQTKTHTVATFQDGGDEGAVRIPFSGALKFARGSIHPDHVQVDVGDSTVPTELRLISAETAPREVIAEMTADHLDVEMATTQGPGRLFVDENEDTFGIGRSHASLMDRFFAEFDEAEQMIASGGCLIDYSLWPTETQGVLANLDQHKIATMGVRVLANDGHGKRWELDVHDGPFGVSFFVDKESDFSKDWTCKSVEGLSLPALSVQAFLDSAAIDVTTHIGMYGFQVVREPVPGGAAAEQGAALFGTRYTASFEPEAGEAVGGGGIRKTPYHFTMHAETERMLGVLVHPADIENFA